MFFIISIIEVVEEVFRILVSISCTYFSLLFFNILTEVKLSIYVHQIWKTSILGESFLGVKLRETKRPR